MKTALITGATSGIGEATAYKLKTNYRLILCGRNKSKLEQLKNEFGEKNCHTLHFDVADSLAVKKAIDSIPESFKNIELLINNAGNAHGFSHLSDADISDLDKMIDINTKGLLYVTKAVIPYMISQTKGHIINLSSIAGKQAYANGVGYCSSKAAVESISTGLRLELVQHNIKVTNIAPGAVETNFSMVRFKNDQKKSDNVYTGYTPLVADDIADCILYCSQVPWHVQIADLTILPTAQANATTIIKN